MCLESIKDKKKDLQQSGSYSGLHIYLKTGGIL